MLIVTSSGIDIFSLADIISTIFCAFSYTYFLLSTSRTNNTNSSPPILPAMSVFSNCDAITLATIDIVWSPTVCPYTSLIALKLSISTAIKACSPFGYSFNASVISFIVADLLRSPVISSIFDLNLKSSYSLIRLAILCFDLRRF